MVHLNKYGEIEESHCSKCGKAIKPSWVACPECGNPLNVNCVNCNKPVKNEWKICPYCGTQISCKTHKINQVVGSSQSNNKDIDCGKGVMMKLKLITVGSFMMGSPDGQGNEPEYPQHNVKFTKPFYMGIYPVTQAQYQAVMKKNPSHFKGPNNPVERVSWNEATGFCEELSAHTGKRIVLPSEAQWEYACRAGSTEKYFFGDNDARLDIYAWYNENSGEKTQPVGQKKPNNFGLYDMLGNVWEWCQDVWHDNYKGAPADGSAWKTGGDPSRRVMRGGCWLMSDYYCRSAGRGWSAPDFTDFSIGFRVCLLDFQ